MVRKTNKKTRQNTKNPGRIVPRASVIASPLILFLIILTVANVFFAWSYAVRYHPGVDFYQQPWGVAEVLKNNDIVNIWSTQGNAEVGRHLIAEAVRPDARKKQKYAAQMSHSPAHPRLGITATPFFFTVMSVFSNGDYTRDHEYYIIFLLAVFVGSIIMLGRLLDYPVSATLVFIVFFLYWFEPTRSELRVANVNIIQMALLILFLAMRTRCSSVFRQVMSGIVLGLGCMFKPNLVIVLGMLLVIWAINRRFRTCGWTIAGMGIAVTAALIASWIYFGTLDCWIHFFNCMFYLTENPGSMASGNFGIARILRTITGYNLSKLLVALSGLTACISMWFGRRLKSESPAEKLDANQNRRQMREDFCAVGLGWTILLISSPVAWFHYYLVIIPFILYVNRRVSAPVRSLRHPVCIRRLLSGLAMLLLASAPMPMLWQPYDTDIQSYLCAMAALIFFVLACWETLELSNAEK